MLKMVNHQFKVLQSVAATLIEGGRGVWEHHFRISLETNKAL
jgi:hypothetical protein